MHILLINSPQACSVNTLPGEHLPPLGLLSIGGPLIDAGHEVQLLDAEFDVLSVHQIVKRVISISPEAIVIGHPSSTAGHTIVADITRLLRRAFAKLPIIYVGRFPTHHWQEILTDEPQINFIVLDEDGESAAGLIHALETRSSLLAVPGIAYWYLGRPIVTRSSHVTHDLDERRVGWELIDLNQYTY